MSEYDTLFEVVSKLELTPEQKEAILSPAKALNLDRGKMGSDLINIKKSLDEANQKNLTYKDFAETMAKHNMKAEDIKKLADKAGIERTNKDDLDALESLVKERDNLLKTTNEELRVFKLEKSLGPQLTKAIADFKDSEGKAVKLLPSFQKTITEELFKGINPDDNEVLINDKINKALLQAKSNQDTFLSENELVSQQGSTHSVEVINSNGSGASSVSPQEIHKVLQDGNGSVDAAIMAMTMAKQQK